MTGADKASSSIARDASSARFAGEIREAQPQDYARIAELAGQLNYPSSAEEIAAPKMASTPLWPPDGLENVPLAGVPSS